MKLPGEALPPLPKPETQVRTIKIDRPWLGTEYECTWTGYTADQMRTYALAALAHSPQEPSAGPFKLDPPPIRDEHCANAKSADEVICPFCEMEFPLTLAAPALLDEADARRCQPNGLMLDAFGEPRKRFVRVSLDGNHCVMYPAEGDRYLQDARDNHDDSPYVVADVWLSQREFDDLPEHDGF